MKNILAILLMASFSSSVFAGISKPLEAKFMRSCKNCHTTKYPRAAQLGDKAAWDALFKANGNDVKKLVASVKKGKGTMPPKGLCMDCTDKEFEDLINYMKAGK